MGKPILLLDCDGVMSNYSKAVIDFVNKTVGERYTVNDITQFNILKSLGQEHLKSSLDREILNTELCLNLEVYPGTLEALNYLRNISQVFCLTAPYSSIVWPGQRIEWLINKLNFDKNEIIITHAKHLVYGHIFVDDRPENLNQWINQWKNLNPKVLPLLWDHLYNKEDYINERVFNWEDVIRSVETLETI
jgi:5'(3')-deoxyribonucleotidase